MTKSKPNCAYITWIIDAPGLNSSKEYSTLINFTWFSKQQALEDVEDAVKELVNDDFTETVVPCIEDGRIKAVAKLIKAYHE
jgi:hypothetical protein